MSSASKLRNTDVVNWCPGIIVSILLLIIFLALQKLDNKLLSLDVKWLVVASVPLIITILRSNIIRKFKGFGFELETRLQELVGNINLTAVDALLDLPGDDKQSVRYLKSMSRTKRLQIQRLTFRSDRKEYYGAQAIDTYLRDLPNLKYFEILDEKGKYSALLPVELFRYDDFIDTKKINDFINALENNDIRNQFKTSLISENVSSSDDLLEALQKVRRCRFGYLPVISEKGYLLGIVTPSIIERKIADEVLHFQARK